MIFYAAGQTPTADTRNLKRQIELSADSEKSLEVARSLYARRFPDSELKGKTLKEMMGMEGYRIRKLYEELAEKYQVGWKERSYVPGKFELGDVPNQILTATNAALYGIISSIVHSLGYSPHIGFIHSGSPLPFVYDLADLYKEHLCMELAFEQTLEMAGQYNRHKVAEAFRQRVIETDLLIKVPQDIQNLIGKKHVNRRRK